VSNEKVVRWIRSGRLPALNVSNGAKRPRYRIERVDLLAFEQREKERIVPPVKPVRRQRQPVGVTAYF